MSGDPVHMLQILGLQYADGEFLPLPEPKYRLEFVGDSITSGEGTVGAVYEEDWISVFFSGIPHDTPQITHLPPYGDTYFPQRKRH